MTQTQGLRGDRLKGIREQRGMRQEEFARRMGVAQQQISRWETGVVHPTDQALIQMGNILNVSVDYLLGLTDEPTAYRAGRALSPMESRLLRALDEGLISEAFEALTELTKERK